MVHQQKFLMPEKFKNPNKTSMSAVVFLNKVHSTSTRYSLYSPLIVPKI